MYAKGLPGDFRLYRRIDPTKKRAAIDEQSRRDLVPAQAKSIRRQIKYCVAAKAYSMVTDFGAD